jgi:DNA-binding MarR family transcriptional regulator
MSDFDLENVIGYQVVRVGEAAERAFTRLMASLGLQVRQFGILVHVAQEDGLPQAALARRLGVTAQSVGPHVEVLVERGLLQRDRPAGRGHPAAVHLTDAGRALLREAAGRAREMERSTTEHLGPGGRARMLADLHGMLERLERS